MVYLQKRNCGRQALGDECHENGHCESERLGGLAFVDSGDPDDEEHNCKDNCDGGEQHYKAGTCFLGLVPKSCPLLGGVDEKIIHFYGQRRLVARFTASELCDLTCRL